MVSLSGVSRSLCRHIQPGVHSYIYIYIYIYATNTPTTKFMSKFTSYVHTHIYTANMRSKESNKCTVNYEQSILIKILNSNVMPTLHRFCWYLYLYFGAQM